MAPCPIIALSATVGNPHEFSQWLASTQDAMNNELVTVQHPHRYSDLRKYFYVPPKQFQFAGIPQKPSLSSLGLENLSGFYGIHPVIAIDKTRGMPEDMALEPRDCYQLWQVMNEVQTQTHQVKTALESQVALPAVVRKIDILTWEKDLKSLLQTWLIDPQPPYVRLVQELEKISGARKQDDVYQTCPGGKFVLASELLDDQVSNTTLALLCRLQEKDALPAIVFNYDRTQCERICQTLCHRLENAEHAQVKTGMKWDKNWKDGKSTKESKKAFLHKWLENRAKSQRKERLRTTTRNALPSWTYRKMVEMPYRIQSGLRLILMLLWKPIALPTTRKPRHQNSLITRSNQRPASSLGISRLLLEVLASIMQE